MKEKKPYLGSLPNGGKTFFKNGVLAVVLELEKVVRVLRSTSIMGKSFRKRHKCTITAGEIMILG
jgi:hypothetical protein